MNDCTMELYEKKNFKIFKKSVKFVEDMQYGLSKSGSCLISQISRALDEKIKLIYTI